jgi:tetratricopeptide (TPR) repeat protein
MQLRPDLGQPHLALARYNLFLNKFDAARSEIAVARKLLPDNSEALFVEARIDRRQNRWDDSLARARRAYELDPQNGEMIEWLCEDFRLMRRYAEGEQFAYLAMKRKPALTSSIYADIAQMKLAEGEPEAAHEILGRLSSGIGIETRFQTALYLRDYNSATQIIATTPAEQADNFFDGKPPFSRADGEVARARGDKNAAEAAFRGAREDWENVTKNGRRDEWYFATVALLDAGLGRKEEAIREAQRAVELVPIESDPLYGGEMIGRLAQVYAWTGEPELAIEKLEMLAKGRGISYGELRFNPCWDSLRNQPRFQKILAGLEPKKLDH